MRTTINYPCEGVEVEECKMNWEEAKKTILDKSTTYLQRDKSGKGYICPICGSGSGKHGTGITTRDGIHYTCWRGCYTNQNIIDIIGLKYGLSEWREKVKKAAEEVGVAILETFSSTRQERKAGETQTDYTEFYAECFKHRRESKYLQERGISEEVQERYNIGYCEGWQSPTALRKGSNPPESPRIIIPTSANSYVAVDTRPRNTLTEAERAFVKMKEGEVHLFNIEALQSTAEGIFVVEGEIDALSLIEIGYTAIGLGSTSNYKKLLEEVKKNKPALPLLIAMDNDEAGKKTSTTLKEELQKLNVECYEVDINGDKKDANEFLMTSREGLKGKAKEALQQISQLQRQAVQNYIDQFSTKKYLSEFVNGLGESAKTRSISTGFEKLDEELDGGLYEGLYIVGAISSLGKTTFCLQMADEIAKAGQDVLIFSLEMARNELIAKSLSRLTAQVVNEKKLSQRLAKSTRAITTAKFYENYDMADLEVIDAAITKYEKYAERLFISEGIGEIGVKEVRERVEEHIHITGQVPVVLVDYLQILAPNDPRSTDKQNIDKAVLELKRLSRDYKMTVLGISSFNRENYKMEVSMQAFKESGAIEYSSDVLIGMQLSGVGSSGFNADEAMKKNPREVELRILKNRNGKTGGKFQLEYYPQFNYFAE